MLHYWLAVESEIVLHVEVLLRLNWIESDPRSTGKECKTFIIILRSFVEYLRVKSLFVSGEKEKKTKSIRMVLFLDLIDAIELLFS